MVTSNVSTAIEDHRDPIEPKSLVVKFRSGLDGSELCSPWEDVSAATLQDAAPSRAFRWHRGRDAARFTKRADDSNFGSQNAALVLLDAERISADEAGPPWRSAFSC